tara:strand:- start:437 stop:1981 length:1545 start_codon:yes stop_codon:yes gene_type:complete
MPKTIGNISEQGLKQIPLPTQHSKQYATVSHGYIIDTVKEELENKGYSINTEEYKCTHNGGVAQGIYYINHGDDPELGLMFAWCNSYDKSTRFKCAVGAHVFVCGNGMMIGDMANYNKKHYGDSAKVKSLVKQHIENQIGTASNYYDMIKHDKDAMKIVCLTENEMMEIMGCVFFKDIITINQLSITKKQYEKPSYDYNAPLNSLWAVYNHITYSLKTSHPKNWMDQQADLHSFIVNNYLPKKVVLDPNQMNISDVIDKEVTPNPLDNMIGEELIPTFDNTTIDDHSDLPLGNDDMNSCPEDEEPKHGIPGTEGGHQFIPDFNPTSLRVRDDKIEQFDNETGEVVKNEALDNAANEEVDHGHNFSQNMVETVAEALDETPDQVNNAFAGIKNQMDEAAAEIKADEEADMIENEEIIEEKEEEDVFNAIADKVKPEVSEETSIVEESKDDLSFDNYFGEEPIDKDVSLSDVNDIEAELKTGSQEDLDEKVEKEQSDIEVEDNSNEGKLELPDFEF